MSVLWHYVLNGKTMDPVPEDRLVAMLAEGTLGPQDLVWREGMSDWKTVGEMPELRGPEAQGAPVAAASAAPPARMPAQVEDSAPSGPAPVSAEAVELLKRTRPWVRFFSGLGFVWIALGLLAGVVPIMASSMDAYFRIPFMARLSITAGCLVFVGVHVPPVFFLHRFAGCIRALVKEPAPENLEKALRAQKSFWKYAGVLTVVALCVYALAVTGLVIAVFALGLNRYI